jgi:hypothetical protein
MVSGLSPPSSSRRRVETGFRLEGFASRSCVNLIRCTRNHPIPPGSAIAFPLLAEMHFTALAAMPYPVELHRKQVVQPFAMLC